MGRLILDEMTRNEFVQSGFVKDMVTLNETLPKEVVMWFFEHGMSSLE